MFLQAAYLRLVFTLVVSMVTIIARRDPGLQLNVSQPTPDGKLTVNCTFGAGLTAIETVTEITLYSTVPCSDTADLEPIASFDLWTSSARLLNDLGEAVDFEVTGGIGKKTSRLTLSAKSRTNIGVRTRRYRCVVKGFNKTGHPVSEVVSTTADDVTVSSCDKIERIANSTVDVAADDQVLRRSVGELRAAVEASALSTNLKLEHLQKAVEKSFQSAQQAAGSTADIAGKVVELEETVNNLEEIVMNQSFYQTFETEKEDKRIAELDETVSNLERSLMNQTTEKEEKERKLAELENTIQDLEGVLKNQTSATENCEKSMAVFQDLEKDFKAAFHTSQIFEGRKYMVSKFRGSFNLPTAQATCTLAGPGYLVEVDNRREYRFVYSFLLGITDNRREHFLTGANDVENEGTFVFYHSKKPMVFRAWGSSVEPSNDNGLEHCVEIRVTGMNDVPCDTVGRFVCEVPQE